jgi:uncharacterized protein
MSKNKPTVVIGASPHHERYSYIATLSLQKHGHDVYPVGIHEGKIGSIDIITSKHFIANIDTVTLYIGPDKQAAWADYIYSLNPKRVIFNPGTENPEFEEHLRNNGIEAIEACTLVLLSIQHF